MKFWRLSPDSSAPHHHHLFAVADDADVCSWFMFVYICIYIYIHMCHPMIRVRGYMRYHIAELPSWNLTLTSKQGVPEFLESHIANDFSDRMHEVVAFRAGFGGWSWLIFCTCVNGHRVWGITYLWEEFLDVDIHGVAGPQMLFSTIFLRFHRTEGGSSGHWNRGSGRSSTWCWVRWLEDECWVLTWPNWETSFPELVPVLS